MSIQLTIQVLELRSFTSNQKHVLTILCFTANGNNEVFLTIEQIMEKTELSRNTVESIMKLFRDQKILTYTGKKAGDSMRIPVYSINLYHPSHGGDKSLITPKPEVDHPKTGGLITPTTGVPINYSCIRQYKDNREFFYFPSLDHFENMEINHCMYKNLPLSHEFKYLQPLLDEAKNENQNTHVE